jgi:hypothetical protein
VDLFVEQQMFRTHDGDQLRLQIGAEPRVLHRRTLFF